MLGKNDKMKAAVIVRKGKANRAFEIREVEKPRPKADEILVKVEGFGLNYADVMARLGLYQDAPKFPAILGYEVVGHIEEVGAEVKHLQVGERVVAMTRFGAYAEYAVSDARAVAVISEKMELGVACTLATQYITAYYSAVEMMNLHKGNHVLVQAAAGGLGTALTQIAKWKGCIVHGTAGSAKKLEYLREQGVDYPINYRTQNFVKEVRKVVGEKGLDVVFDSIGGGYIPKALHLVGAGGRVAAIGLAKMSNANLFQKVALLAKFGIYSPIWFMLHCKTLVGINMLRIADNRPDVIQRCLKNVVELTQKGILNPTVGGEFSMKEIGKAHELLESRKSIGKIIVRV